MASRNVDKGREAENAVAAYLSLHGFPHVERRAKRGGTFRMDCECRGIGTAPLVCAACDGTGLRAVPADAGDLTGIPGLVIQVKWSGYKPLAEDMRRTEEQRRAGRADIGLLVRKRKGVGLARAGEWDAYLPQWAVEWLLVHAPHSTLADGPSAAFYLTNSAPWHTDLATAAALIRRAGYGAHDRDLETVR